MFILYGTRLFGRVDQVAGHCYVATQFVHLYFIPIIPLRSFIVADGEQSDSASLGHQIPMSLKSVLVAYARAGLAVTAIYNLVRVFVSLYDGAEGQSIEPMGGLVKVGTAILCMVAFWATYQLFQANEQKAKMLCHYMGIRV